jgi:hypothetical protein
MGESMDYSVKRFFRFQSRASFSSRVPEVSEAEALRCLEDLRGWLKNQLNKNK